MNVKVKSKMNSDLIGYIMGPLSRQCKQSRRRKDEMKIYELN
jgi:hypothetical protein